MAAVFNFRGHNEEVNRVQINGKNWVLFDTIMTNSETNHRGLDATFLKIRS